MKIGDSGLTRENMSDIQKIDIHIDDVYAKGETKFDIVGHEHMFSFKGKEVFESLWQILKGDY